MRIAQVVGTVTLSRAHPSFRGSRLKLAVRLSLANVTGQAEPGYDPLVVWDDLGAGIGDTIALADGPDAAQPFRPEIKPVDAYNAALLDRLDIDVEPN
jgi:ethanolamine utilization protein EutN